MTRLSQTAIPSMRLTELTVAQRVGLALSFITLAGLTNFWTANLFFGLSFVFGTTWAFLALSTLGLWTGLAAGVLAVGVGLLKIHNLLFAFISLPEVVFISFLYRYYQKDLIHCSVLYWITLGPLLYYTFYRFGLSPSFDQFDYLVVFLKLAVNGILNALFASLLSLFLGLAWPNASRSRLGIPIHQAIFYVLLTLILVPSLLMISLNSQARFERMQLLLSAEVKGRADSISQFLQEWQKSNSQPLSEDRLKELLSRLVVEEGWNASIYDEHGKVLVTTAMNAPVLLPHSRTLLDKTIKMTGPSSYSRDLSLPKASPFIRWQKFRLGAVVHIPSSNWTIAAEGPTSNYARALKQGLIENLVLMLILCFLGLVVSGFLSKIIGRPIAILAKLTSHLHSHSGPQKVSAWPQSRIWEIACLITNYRTMQEELSRRFQELQKADQAKSAFLATISHEIRTPLSAILGFSDLLLKQAPQDSVSSEHLRAIKRNGEQLLAVIGDVLDLSKIEAGKLCLEKIVVPLSSLIDDVIRSLHLQTKAKGLSFDLHLDPQLPTTVSTDPTRFRQILWNLTSNAIKFTAHGGIKVYITAGWHEKTQQYRLSFKIEDSGIGIATEQQEAIFEAFVQADSSMNRRFGGSGLGLVLSRRLAEAMGGHLDLDWSKAGVGSSFTFGLAVTPEAWNVPLLAEEGNVSSMGLIRDNESAPKVLLVDDAPDNLLLVKFLLESQGAHVVCAKDALEGLDRFRSEDMDLIVTDIQMPVMDGYEFVRHIRAINSETPIIAMTAHALSEEQDRCLSAGCNAYLSKPLNSEKLFELIRTLTLNLGTPRTES